VPYSLKGFPRKTNSGSGEWEGERKKKKEAFVLLKKEGLMMLKGVLGIAQEERRENGLSQKKKIKNTISPTLDEGTDVNW